MRRLAARNVLCLAAGLVVLAPWALGQNRGVGGVVAPDGTTVGKQWLLVIGIDKYQNWRAWPELDCAVSDAKAVRDVLRERYHIDELVELYDGEATREAIIEKLRWLWENTKGPDGVLVYYAGHGHMDKAEGIGFWVPVDGARQPYTWIGNDRIKRYVGNMKAKHVLLISDSCFAGDFFKERTGIPTINEPYYKRAYAKQSRQAMTSGGVEPVADASLRGHSPFAFWMLDCLKRNDKPYLVPNELFDEIKLGVTRNSRQTPRVGYLHGAQDAGGEFVFFLKQTRKPVEVARIPDMSSWEKQQAEFARQKAAAEARKKLLAAAERAFGFAKQCDEADFMTAKQKVEKWEAYLRDFESAGHQLQHARRRLAHWQAGGTPVPVRRKPSTTTTSPARPATGLEEFVALMGAEMGLILWVDVDSAAGQDDRVRRLLAMLNGVLHEQMCKDQAIPEEIRTALLDVQLERQLRSLGISLMTDCDLSASGTRGLVVYSRLEGIRKFLDLALAHEGEGLVHETIGDHIMARNEDGDSFVFTPNDAFVGFVKVDYERVKRRLLGSTDGRRLAREVQKTCGRDLTGVPAWLVSWPQRFPQARAQASALEDEHPFKTLVTVQCVVLEIRLHPKVKIHLTGRWDSAESAGAASASLDQLVGIFISADNPSPWAAAVLDAIRTRRQNGADLSMHLALEPDLIDALVTTMEAKLKARSVPEPGNR